MGITINLEETEGRQNFVDFAYRLTRKGIDQPTKTLGNEFLKIITPVLPNNQGGNDLAPENVVDTLHKFFQDNGYRVSKRRCLQILKYHKEYRLPEPPFEY